MLLPAFGMMAAFFLWPTLFNISNSFTDLSLLGLRDGGEWIGFDNYIELFRDPDFRKVVFNTLFWLTFVSVTLRLVLGFGLAVFIESDLVRRLRLTVPLRMAALLPWATPDIVAVTVWKQILDGRSGVINNWLMDWGFIEKPIVFLANASYVWPSIITIIVWNGLPLVTLTMAAALQTVPKDLIEAAEIDGAGPVTRFWHVTFPQVMPALLVLGLLTTIWTFNNFIYVWMSTSAGPGTFSNVLATEVYLQGFVNFKLGLSSAIGTFMAALALIFGIIYFRKVVLKRFRDLI
ncbi:sugar ABC transporter permease [Acuticoccus sp. MNP-M23]|uniref:carbohydrate ABC transporter permease n=1 Tax=Acuticoccus sp. MNP-M23 TaxID=3072793 RepID=UPI0028151BE4|nr:sugar ABC transporter permease [Acuticoccus sp. MNP-M23]WMS44013.1 sugar ABC transporter permease [Acuticoccus sp. MNP-M23]